MTDQQTPEQRAAVEEAAREGYGTLYTSRLDPKITGSGDYLQCPYIVKSLASGHEEQCALDKGHKGKHMWGRGD